MTRWGLVTCDCVFVLKARHGHVSTSWEYFERAERVCSVHGLVREQEQFEVARLDNRRWSSIQEALTEAAPTLKVPLFNAYHEKTGETLRLDAVDWVLRPDRVYMVRVLRHVGPWARWRLGRLNIPGLELSLPPTRLALFVGTLRRARATFVCWLRS